MKLRAHTHARALLVCEPRNRELLLDSGHCFTILGLKIKCHLTLLHDTSHRKANKNGKNPVEHPINQLANARQVSKTPRHGTRHEARRPIFF